MLKLFRIILLLFSVGLFAQSKVDVNALKTFNPDENSKLFNEAYTHNFFFGNFGIKHLVNAIPINYKSVKTMKITSEVKAGKNQPMLEFTFDAEGKLTQMKIYESFSGEDITVDYLYKEGVISEEVFTTKENKRTNKFFYGEGKMTVETSKGMLDSYQLKDKILYKTSYLDGKLVFKDRIDGKCRITRYQNKEDINKICFSNFSYQFPFSLEEFTTKEDLKTGKVNLIKDKTIELKKQSDDLYAIYTNQKEVYQLHLDKDARIKEFKFLGNKSERVQAISFSFSYTYYN